MVSFPSSLINFVLDFDGTITTKDTIDSIAKFALSTQRGKGNDLSSEWYDIVAKYGQEYASHCQEYSPSIETRDTVQKETDFCRSLRKVETASFQ